MPTTQQNPGISFSFMVRVSYPNHVEYMAKLTECISEAGGDLGAIDMIASGRMRMTRDLTVQARNEEHVESILEALKKIDDVEILHFSKRVFHPIAPPTHQT